MTKAMYIGISNKPTVTLPEGYTELEHIEFTGKQILNSWIKPTADTKIEICFSTTDLTHDKPLFGVRKSNSEANFLCWFNPQKTDAPYFAFGDGSYVPTGWGITGVKHTVTLENGKFTMDGREYAFAEKDLASDYWLTIGGLNNADAVDSRRFYGLIHYAKIWIGTFLDRYFIPCRKSDGTIGFYNLVWGDFFENAGDGQFIAGAELNGTGSVARKVKKMYVGVDNKARKVKKAYIGVNGIARKFFGAELIYKGAITSLRTSRGYMKGASVGEYMLFGGGMLGSNYTYSSDVVDAYDSSFVRSNAPALSNGVHHLASASIGKYALFAGGYKGTYSTRSSVVNTYDESLTKGTATTLSSARGTLGATTVGNHALFAGGYPICATVEAYNESLTKSSVTNLSQAREFLAGATNGTHALFAGGQNDGGSTTYSTVDAYDSSLTKVSVTSLSSARSKYAGASFGKYAVFDGSWSCEFYDQSLTKVYTDVSHGGYWDSLQGAGLDNEYAVFACWREIKVYDTSFTRQVFARTDISSELFGVAIASNGNRAIIAGGNTVNNAVALEIT